MQTDHPASSPSTPFDVAAQATKQAGDPDAPPVAIFFGGESAYLTEAEFGFLESDASGQEKYTAQVSISGTPPVEYQAWASSSEEATYEIANQLFELARSMSTIADKELTLEVTTAAAGAVTVTVMVQEEHDSWEALSATISDVTSGSRQGSRNLLASDDEVSGGTQSAIEDDAGFKRANLIWEAIVQTYGGDLPPLSAEQDFNLVLQLYTGHDTGVDDAFFDLLFENNGQYSPDMELAHPHYPPDLLEKVFDDAASCFMQATHMRNRHRMAAATRPARRCRLPRLMTRRLQRPHSLKASGPILRAPARLILYRTGQTRMRRPQRSGMISQP